MLDICPVFNLGSYVVSARSTRAIRSYASSRKYSIIVISLSHLMVFIIILFHLVVSNARFMSIPSTGVEHRHLQYCGHVGNTNGGCECWTFAPFLI